jgi:beta-lactamase regulating signal transducer with metallopeptidase domain
MNAISATLTAVLNSLGPAAAVALAVWAGTKLLPRTNAATRYIVWWAALVTVAALPVAPSLLEWWRTPPIAAAVAPAPAAARVAPSGEAPVVPPPVATRALLPLQVTTGGWLWGLFALWSAVAVVQLGRIVWSYWYLRGVKQRAQPVFGKLRLSFDEWALVCRVRRPVRLLVSGEIVSPMAVGFLRPAVIVPARLLPELGEAEMDHVLLHELAHLARRDDWANLVAAGAAGVFALHPVAAWILGRIKLEREMACDDWVVAATGAARPYAASLARLFELCLVRRRELLAAGMAERASQLRARIELLLRRRHEMAPCASAVRVAVSVVALLAMAAAGALVPAWIAFADAPAPFALAVVATQETVAPAPMPMPPAAPRARTAPARRPPALHPAQLPPPALLPPAAQLPPPAQAPQPAQPLPSAQPRPPAAPAAGPAPPAALAAPAAPASRESLLAALVAAGYGDLSVEDIIDLKNNGISADFIHGVQQAGWSKLAPRQLLDLRANGVTPEYLRQAREAGVKDLSVKDVLEMRAHGVRLERVQEIHALGFGPYSARQTIDFAIHDVRPELFRALKDAGFDQVDPREILEARRHGLRPSDLREARTYGQKLTLKQIIRLKLAGVI